MPIEEVAIENCEVNAASPKNTYIRISAYLFIFSFIAEISLLLNFTLKFKQF